MKNQNPDKPQRDQTRNRWGVKAERRKARRAKDKRRKFETSGRWK